MSRVWIHVLTIRSSSCCGVSPAISSLKAAGLNFWNGKAASSCASLPTIVLHIPSRIYSVEQKTDRETHGDDRAEVQWFTDGEDVTGNRDEHEADEKQQADVVSQGKVRPFQYRCQ